MWVLGFKDLLDLILKMRERPDGKPGREYGLVCGRFFPS
jgi:hypothetical protein